MTGPTPHVTSEFLGEKKDEIEMANGGVEDTLEFAESGKGFKEYIHEFFIPWQLVFDFRIYNMRNTNRSF